MARAIAPRAYEDHAMAARSCATTVSRHAQRRNATAEPRQNELMSIQLAAASVKCESGARVHHRTRDGQSGPAHRSVAMEFLKTVQSNKRERQPPPCHKSTRTEWKIIHLGLLQTQLRRVENTISCTHQRSDNLQLQAACGDPLSQVGGVQQRGRQDSKGEMRARMASPPSTINPPGRSQNQTSVAGGEPRYRKPVSARGSARRPRTSPASRRREPETRTSRRRLSG